jgi:hypothetical protein
MQILFCYIHCISRCVFSFICVFFQPEAWAGGCMIGDLNLTICKREEWNKGKHRTSSRLFILHIAICHKFN